MKWRDEAMNKENDWDRIPKIYITPEDLFFLRQSPYFIPSRLYLDLNKGPCEVGCFDVTPEEESGHTQIPGHPGVWKMCIRPALRFFVRK